jgi:hypothetical protein
MAYLRSLDSVKRKSRSWLMLKTPARKQHYVQFPTLSVITGFARRIPFAFSWITLASVDQTLAPALQSLKRNVSNDLHESTRSVTSGRTIRRVLVISEIALSFVFVSGAGLLVRNAKPRDSPSIALPP